MDATQEPKRLDGLESTYQPSSDGGLLAQEQDRTDANVEGGNRDDDPSQEIPRRPEYEEEPKYGWVIVACVFLTNAHTWGLIQSYGIFLAYFLNSGVFRDPNPLALAFVASLSFCTTLMMSPPATYLVPKIGTRQVVILGTVIEAGSLIGASFTSRIWHLVLSQGIGFGIGNGLIAHSTIALVPQWFTRRRSFTTAITTAGTGTGGLIYSLGSHAMIENIGLAWSFRVLAIVVFGVNLLASVFLRERRHATGAVYHPFDIRLFRQPAFSLFLAWGFFMQMGFAILVFSLADFVQSMGHSSSQSSVAVAVFNVSQAVGRPLMGLASDRFGRLDVAFVSSAVACVSTLLIWILAGRYYAGTIVYALFGAFASGMWPIVAPVGAEVVGLQSLPSALSIFWLVLALPTLFAEPIAVTMKHPGVHGYTTVQVFCGCMFLGGTLAVWFLRTWKVQQQERATAAEPQGDAPNEGQPQARKLRKTAVLARWGGAMFRIVKV